MKTIIAVLALALVAIVQSGCSAGGSVSHDGHRHGAGVSATTSGPGASMGARTY